MSSKRDLVEAHSFNRRRLVTAFVSGAPGGREVEPVRHGRTLVGGLVLAVLLVAGAAVSGLLAPTVPDDWLDSGLVVGKGSGARFVAYHGTLYPVANTASARLIVAPEGKLQVTFAPDDLIAQQPQGPTLGIVGAPDALPAPSRLRQTGWTACTDDTEDVNVRIGETPGAVPVRDGALVVHASGAKGVFVVADGRRFPVPDRYRRSTLRALGLDGEPVHDVAGLWLDALPVGPPLVPFTVPHAGRSARELSSRLDRIGDAVRVDGRPYVVLSQGLLPVSEFAFALYTSDGFGAAGGRPPSYRSGDLADVPTAGGSADPVPDEWPTGRVRALPGEDYCLLLHTHADEAATVSLATPVADDAPARRGAGRTASVQTGHGALVYATSAGVQPKDGQRSGAPLYLLDATGTSYAVGTKGASRDAQVRLGYGDVQPVAVPDTWLDLFDYGPALTTSAAVATAEGS